jgi:predicted metalloendopeptidase
MKKIIAKEVNPAHVDFSYYFDDDGLKSVGGKNCAVYIVPADRRRHSGFNMDEYGEIEEKAEAIIDGFRDVSDKWANGYDSYANYKEVLEYNNVPYSPRKCHLLKKWAERANPYNTNDIAEFLTITTGEEWTVKAFIGYSQGDYCEVVYCINHYTPEHITEIGKFWLGCGTEFCIDGCYGYYVPDTIRWQEGETLRKYLADCYGCKPEELEIYLYDGEHMVTDYKIMD